MRAIIYVKFSLKLVSTIGWIKIRTRKVAKGVILLSFLSITNNLLYVKSLLGGLKMLFKPSDF